MRPVVGAGGTEAERSDAGTDDAGAATGASGAGGDAGDADDDGAGGAGGDADGADGDATAGIDVMTADRRDDGLGVLGGGA
jgi:hypothetical protein